MGKYISNKPEKKEEVEKGPPKWTVAWADDISETDAAMGLVAVGVSIYTGNAGAFLEWVRQLLQQTIDSLLASASEEFPNAIRSQVEQLALDTIKAAVQGNSAKEVFKQYDTIDFKAGGIKYSGRNYEWNIFAQRYDPIGPPTWGLKPFIAFRWRGSSGGGGDGGSSGGGGNQGGGNSGVDTGTPLDGDGSSIDTGVPF